MTGVESDSFCSGKEYLSIVNYYYHFSQSVFPCITLPLQWLHRRKRSNELTMEYRCSAGAGVGSLGLAWRAGGRGVTALGGLGLRSWGRGGWRSRAGGWLWCWCAGSLLTTSQALWWWTWGSLVWMRAPSLAVLLVLNLLKVLLSGPHLSVF